MAKVTFHAARNVFKKKVGGRTFYFGSVKGQAELEAEVISARWLLLKQGGHTAWPSGEPNRIAIRSALGLLPSAALAGGFPAAAPVPAAQPKTVEVGALTVSDAAKIYLDEIKRTKGERWSRDIGYRLRKALPVFGADKKLSAIGQAELVEFVSHWRNEKLGNLYVRRIVQTAKAFLLWASEHDAIDWAKPQRFDTIMLVEDNSKGPALTPELKRAQRDKDKERKHFTIDELKTLYSHADKQFRALILLGLNCAYGPGEASALLVDDIKNNVIDTVRPKTGERMRHKLWPETLSALKAAKAKANKDGRYFLTVKGKPLVTPRYNSIPHEWRKLCEASTLKDCLPFHNLRHTSAQAMREIAGQEMAELHTAHAQVYKMQEHYTERLYSQHDLAIEKLREHFLPVFTA